MYIQVAYGNGPAQVLYVLTPVYAVEHLIWTTVLIIIAMVLTGQANVDVTISYVYLVLGVSYIFL